TLGERADEAAIEAVLGDPVAAPFVKLTPGTTGDGISALAAAANRDVALVGRVRKDMRDASGRTFCITAAGDNLRLGAAPHAVRVASRWFPSADPALQTS